MKLLKLIQATDDQALFVRAENIMAFNAYDEGAAIELTSGSVFMVRESPKMIMALLGVATGEDVTVINSSDVTIQ